MCPTDPVAGPGDRAGVPLAKRDGSRDTGEHIGESSLRLVQAADTGPHPRSSREGERGAVDDLLLRGARSGARGGGSGRRRTRGLDIPVGDSGSWKVWRSGRLPQRS